jgi:hypothetical protein
MKIHRQTSKWRSTTIETDQADYDFVRKLLWYFGFFVGLGVLIILGIYHGEGQFWTHIGSLLGTILEQYVRLPDSSTIIIPSP